MNNPSQKEIVTSSSLMEIESALWWNETPGVLKSMPETETQTFVYKWDYASKLVYQRSSLVIDIVGKRVLVALRKSEENKWPRLISGASIMISNIRNKVTGIDWDKQALWFPLTHILKKNAQGWGYLFGVEFINGTGTIDNMSSAGDTVAPATIEEMLGILETEKPLEYKLLRSIEGMEFGTVTGPLD